MAERVAGLRNPSWMMAGTWPMQPAWLSKTLTPEAAAPLKSLVGTPRPIEGGPLLQLLMADRPAERQPSLASTKMCTNNQTCTHGFGRDL